jgi:hypothetical protein
MPATYTPVDKQFLLDVQTDLGITPDNLEGMAFGGLLPDGRLPLILVSDNNFDPAAVTQFIVLAVRQELAENCPPEADLRSIPRFQLRFPSQAAC